MMTREEDSREQKWKMRRERPIDKAFGSYSTTISII
jgi:hypothetical protein